MSEKPDTDGYAQIHTVRAFEEVSAQIRRRVIHGHLRPGDRLPAERELAAKLGVSRNTVREALRGLEMAGVLRLQKGARGGAFVVAPNGDNVGVALQDMFQLGTVSPRQLTEARLHMTAIVVRLACERMTEEILQALEKNVADALAAGEAGDFVTRSRTLLEIHNILARATGNPIFAAVMKGLIAIMQQFIDVLGPPQGMQVFPSRRRFIAHLRADRPEEAIKEMAMFLRDAHDSYLSRLEASGAEEEFAGANAPAKKPRPAKKERSAKKPAPAKKLKAPKTRNRP
jgi:DNA-binding FadR family transcriptional regulator